MKLRFLVKRRVFFTFPLRHQFFEGEKHGFFTFRKKKHGFFEGEKNTGFFTFLKYTRFFEGVKTRVFSHF